MWTASVRLTRLGGALAVALVPYLGDPACAGAQWLPSHAGAAAAGMTAPQGGPTAADTEIVAGLRPVIASAPTPELRASTAAARHRSPLLAGFLGVLPGLGHAYAGEPKRALLVAGVWLGSGLVMFGSSEKVVTGVAAGVNIGSYVFSIADAVLAAQRFNRRHAPGTTTPDGGTVGPGTAMPRADP